MIPAVCLYLLPQLARGSEFVRRDGRAGTGVMTRTSAPPAVGRQTLHHPASGGKTRVSEIESMTDIQTAMVQVGPVTATVQVGPVTAMAQRVVPVVMGL